MTAQPTRLKNPLFTKGEYANDKGRLYFYDNAKFLLIFFVVFAHAISPYKESQPEYMVLWAMMNTLHMPCLIFISGFFAKNYLTGSSGIKVQRPFTYIILYLAAQFAVTLFEIVVLKRDVAWSLFQARSSLWFLQCLIGWYILLPVLDKFKPSYVLAGSFFFGLLIGYDSKVADLASLSRMFVHLPFFMAGYYCTEERISKLFTLRRRLIAALFIVVTAILCFVFVDHIQTAIITCNRSYGSIRAIFAMPVYTRWTARALFYLVAAGLSVSFLALTPRCKTFYTRFGSRTLQVYILHRFLYLAYLQYGWWKPFDTFWGRIAIGAIALALTLLLSLKVFAIPFEALQNIKIPKALLKLQPPVRKES